MKMLQIDYFKELYLWRSIIAKYFNLNQLIQQDINSNYLWQLTKLAKDAYSILNNNNNIIINNNIIKFKITAPDLLTEFQLITDWIKQELRLNNNINIAIIILYPNITNSQIEYIFQDFLNNKYNANYIKVILLILNIANNILNNQLINYEDFSQLLRTKFIAGYNEEFNDRLLADFIIRQHIRAQSSWQDIINKLNNKKIDIFTKLCDNFTKTALFNYESNLQKHSYSYWFDYSKNLLQAFGFTEIDAYINLDLSGSYSFSEFINILAKFTQEINDKFNNIKVLDLTTVLNLNIDLDYVWICGLNNNINISSLIKINPFLPKNLQVNNADNIIQKLYSKINKAIIVSSATWIDGNKVDLHSITNDFVELNLKLNNNNLNLKTHLELEQYTDNYAPVYNSNKFSGISFLRLQNACPFRANAKTRLKAQELHVPTNYLDYAVKGNIIHKILEEFYKNYDNNNIYANLCLITKKILKYYYSDNLLNAETKRIANICSNFIKLFEINRNFKILYLEQKFTVYIKDIAITIKIDRIDQLPNNQVAIIDYKTGNINTNINFIDDPQMLIYSLSMPNVKDLILAKVAKEPKIIYLKNWQQTKNDWYEELYKLVQDFKNGIAHVNPKYKESTCRTCDLKYACRIYVTR